MATTVWWIEKGKLALTSKAGNTYSDLTDAKTITVLGSAVEDYAVADITTSKYPDIPAEFHRALVYYIRWKLFEDEGDEKTSLFYERKWHAALKEAKRSYRGIMTGTREFRVHRV
jgi:hypothetical protein|tara:strand:+ start:18504 stop:18848 length:345 start_codon:yes stop_codon:yes gene_type:complete